MSIDWNKLESNNKSKAYTEYAKLGTYKVKVERMELTTVPTGSVAQNFFFEKDDYKYPKVTHWLSFNNPDWRAMHNKQLLEFLGVSTESAKKLIDNAEAKDDKESIIKAYQAIYDKVISGKHPEVEIEVWPDDKDDKYSKADFNDRVRMNRPKTEEKAPVKEDDVLADAAPADDLDEIPFD